MLSPSSPNHNNMSTSSLQTSLHERSTSVEEIAINSNITGEVYYINWISGMKAKDQDPSSSSNSSSSSRTTTNYSDDDESSYEEEEGSAGGLSSAESSSSSAVSSSRKENESESEQVLVVGGCKRCLMYFMVAKQVEECPKCNAQLLHFHRTDPISS